MYQDAASTDDRDQLFAFIRQLNILTTEQPYQTDPQRPVAAMNGDLRGEQLHLSAEKLTAVGKAVAHRFGGLTGYRNVNRMVQKAIESRNTHDPSVIR